MMGDGAKGWGDVHCAMGNWQFAIGLHPQRTFEMLRFGLLRERQEYHQMSDDEYEKWNNMEYGVWN